MPSKRRLRHTSTSNAPQVLLNSAKSSSFSGSLSGPATPTSSNSSVVLTTSTSNNSNKHQIPKSNSTPINCFGDTTNECGLTDKQLRNQYLLTLTKEQLRAECRKRGQKTTGNRTELLQRLGVKMSQLNKQDSSDAANNLRKVQKQTTTKSSPIIYNGSTPAASAAANKKISPRSKEREREERKKIVLWRRPTQTIKYCFYECYELSQTYGKKLRQNRSILGGILVLIAILGVFYKIPGRHQEIIDLVRANTWFVVYWVGLGVLSSVGLGTGLHTFLLYLGPHIASVTLAAYECNSLNFPKPPYPDDIICPETPDGKIPNLWSIMSKVRLEAFLWGAGTALGELPPYFMARAARLSGYDPDDDEDLEEFEELQKKAQTGELSVLDRGKIFMERVVERVGFFGILACASIPNPLFDLAGITCGHFLVPFWTFFGATLIGKAIIKMHIQKIFVIIAFNEALIERAVDVLGAMPIVGRRLQEPFKTFLENQKIRLHRQSSVPAAESGNVLAKFFEKFVIAMICYFVISIVNSLAQSYHKRLHKKGDKVSKKVHKAD